MTKWKTKLVLTTNDQTMETEEIKTGIFQRDSPSGLHFVICLLPLSRLIRQSRVGYTIGTRNARQLISHLMFMDDLKLYAAGISQLNTILEIVMQFSQDI